MLTPRPDCIYVECKKNIIAEYTHVDFKEMNRISENAYTELERTLKNNEGEYQTDDMMVILAMMVRRFGAAIDAYVPDNNWADDAFPEFCSMISPVGGFEIRKRAKDEPASDGTTPSNS